MVMLVNTQVGTATLSNYFRGFDLNLIVLTIFTPTHHKNYDY